MDAFRKLADARIADAIARGDFDGLRGHGKPLDLEDLSRVPAEYRMAYKVLRNAGEVPPEIEARREVYRLDRMIAEGTGDEDVRELRRRRMLAQLRLNLMAERRVGGGRPGRGGRLRRRASGPRIR